MGCRGISQQGRDRYSHERVQRTPDQVKGRNFVCNKFDDEQDDAGGDDPLVFEQVKWSGKRQQFKPRQ